MKARMLKTYFREKLRDIRRALSFLRRVKVARECPICGFSGYFHAFSMPIRNDAECAGCGSLERHRLLWLWLASRIDNVPQGVLHFAAEKVLERSLRKKIANYRTADLFATADLKLDIEQLALDDSSIGTVICNHVLEHVDDRRALQELLRVLKPGGLLIVSVPLVEGWSSTYENPSVTGPRERELHFGQFDHVRYYGRDFRDRLQSAGFKIETEVTAEGPDVCRYGLLRGEKVFICRAEAK